MCPCRSQLPPPCERRAKPQKTTSSPFPRGCLARYSPAGGCEGDEEGFHRVPLTANPAASLKDVRETAARRSPPSPQTPSSEAAAVPDPPRPPCRTGGGAASRGAGRGSAALGKERRPPGKGGRQAGRSAPAMQHRLAGRGRRSSRAPLQCRRLAVRCCCRRRRAVGGPRALRARSPPREPGTEPASEPGPSAGVRPGDPGWVHR